jgi:hypothetical protein
MCIYWKITIHMIFEEWIHESSLGFELFYSKTKISNDAFHVLEWVSI